MSSVAQICPRCARPIPASAPKGLCSRCLISSLLDQLAGDDAAGAEPMPAPAIPSERVGNYELLEQIGRGGMGVVFRARDLRLNRTVALKLIVTGKLASQLEVKRFFTEAASAARLEHPNIVPIYEVGEAEGRHFFAMKLMERGTLDEAMAKEDQTSGTTPPDIRHSTFLLTKIARAVHHAHQRGILHRDLKPGNILLDSNGEPMVSDFGLARQLESESDLTLSGTVLGSPSYMAPEQAAGRAREVTTAADIYSLGAVLFHLLTGQPPFRESSAVATMHAVVEHEPPRPSALNPVVDRDLETICLKCLEKEPARRYTSAAALADDLDRWQRGEPILARPPGAAERVWKWARRRPTTAALIIVSALALVGLLILQQVNETNLTHERDFARQQENLAKSSERIMRENLYTSDMLLASRAIEEGNVALAQRTLQGHRPKPGEADLRGWEWRYLWRKSHGEQFQVLGGFTSSVPCVAFSPDGRWLAAGGGRLMQVWNATNRQLVATMTQDNPVRSLCFSPEGTTLWVGDSRGHVRVWITGMRDWVGLMTRGKGLVQVAAPAGSANWVAVSERDRTDGKSQGAVALYSIFDMLTRNERGNVLTNSGGLAAFSRDGKLLLTGGGQAPLLLHNLGTGETKQLAPPGQEVSALALAPDGRTAAACNYNSYGLVLVDTVSGKQFWWKHDGAGSLGAVAFSPDGRYLAIAAGDHTVMVWDVVKDAPFRRFVGHSAAVLSVAFSPDGQTIASGGADQTVRLWRLAALNENDTLPSAFAPFVFSTDGRTLTARTSDSGDPTPFRHLDVATGKPKPGPELMMDLASYPTPSLADTAPPLRAFLSGELTREHWAKFTNFMTCHPDHIPTAVACAEAAGLVALGHKSGVVKWWDFRRATPLPDLATGERGLALLALTPDGRWLAVAGRSNIVSIWDVASRTNRLSLPGRDVPVHVLAFSPDGRVLATGNEDTTAQLWDAASGALLATLAGHNGPVGRLAFSPDGRTLFSSGGAGLKLWHMATRREVATLSRSAASDWPTFSPDGTTLLTAHWDGTTYLWRAPTLAEIDAETTREKPGRIPGWR